ncbi:MAG: hypothetical protein ABI771_07490 [Betaproteobacteria bacterium]
MDTEPAPQHTQLLGMVDHEKAIDTILQQAKKRILLFDHSLGKGYNSVARTESIRKFLLANRRNTLQIVLHDTQSMDRYCPRLLSLLRAHGHAISIHETQLSAKSVYDPFIVVDDHSFVHRFHFDEVRGLLALDDPFEAHAFVERFAEIWEASSPAVSATTLGL